MMKSLVYGIDGGDRRILEYFDMPFYSELSRSHVHLDLTEDLLSRGWSEIITGAPGMDTRGFYMAPDLDGSARFSASYRMGNVTAETGIKLIWDQLPDGSRIGVMNVPSLLPVVPVNGFCVGSAGAGISKIESISDDLAYPTAARDYLNDNHYIPDLRLNSADIDTVDEWFMRLKEMESRRIDCFIHLASQYQIDFGLLIDRATTVVQYLFMSEIDALMNRDEGKEPAFAPTPDIEARLRDFYTFLDNNIRKLVESLSPQQLILTADHGHEPMKYHCNPNALLATEGLYHPITQSLGARVKARARASLKGLPRRYKKRIRASLESLGIGGTLGTPGGPPIDSGRTLAFSHYQIPGIFLNDERFNGPVKSDQSAALVERICRLFNEHPLSRSHGITAHPYRSQHLTSRYSDKLPDVRLELPGNTFTTCLERDYITTNPLYGPVPNFDRVGSEMHTGTKGSRPLCLVDTTTASLREDGDDDDLTIVYKLVGRFFNRVGGQ